MYDSPRTIDIRGEDVPVMLEEHALKIGIDDRELLGAVDAEVYRSSLRQAKTRALARRMLISHNKEVFDYANSVIPGITSVDGITEANKWSDRSKPVVSILTSLINKFAVNNGVYPNRILTTRDVWADIQANTEVQTMMGEMGRKVLTPETLLELIGLQGDDIPPVRVMRTIASYNPGGTEGTEVDNVNIVGSNIYLFYADDNPSLDDISALKTLNLAGDDMYSTVETYRDEDISTEWLRVRGHHKVVFAAPSAMMRMQIA
ncbi:hypothetical protein [Paramuribaculum intestinale]|uniref:hypothetical protein n=2 Tax=Pseudomonadati TaxID=3379134 RepID=UPI00260983F9|nr:hypothetical protein [Paramuribaculum intestinale]